MRKSLRRSENKTRKLKFHTFHNVSNYGCGSEYVYSNDLSGPLVTHHTNDGNGGGGDNCGGIDNCDDVCDD